MKKTTKRELKRMKSKIKNKILTIIFSSIACLFIFSVTAIDTEHTIIFKAIMIATFLLLCLFGYANKDYVLKES